jgi:NADH-quinone oxidoreductase subunit M
MNGIPILTLLTLLPVVGGVIVIGLAADQRKLARGLSFGFSLIALAIAVVLWTSFDTKSGMLQFEEARDWIPSLGVKYHLGVDGLSLVLVLLTAIVVPMSMLASWRVEQRTQIYFALVLFLQGGLFGTFTAHNFFHWFLFWELSLIPAFFLIRLWGGPGRTGAATQFFVYTMVGSVAMLLAFLAIFLATADGPGANVDPAGRLDFATLAELGRNGRLVEVFNVKLGWYFLSKSQLAKIILAGVFLGFAVKVPLVPFHTWLPTTYAEAPTGTTMLLTGLMSKMGVYGFIRVLLPIFPDEIRSLLTPLLWLAVITIVYSAGAAFAQRDLKRMLGYSSINHLGYCVLGVFVLARATTNDAAATDKAAALNGVILQLFNHGLTASTLFWFVGFLEQRTGLRGVNDFGGLRKVAPILCGLMGIALFSSLGLPGLNGFAGEFLIFRGVFPLSTWSAALATLGLLITAVFILTLIQKVFHGPLNQRWATLPDLSIGERALLFPALLLMLVLGVYPQLIVGVINSTVVEMVRQMTS